MWRRGFLILGVALLVAAGSAQGQLLPFCDFPISPSYPIGSPPQACCNCAGGCDIQGIPTAGSPGAGSASGGGSGAGAGEGGGGNFLGGGNYGTGVIADLSVPGVAGTITFSRRYDSQWHADGPLGIGWTGAPVGMLIFRASYLLAAPATYRTTATVTLEEGLRGVFLENADGLSYQSPFGRGDVLQRNGDGSWYLFAAQSRAAYTFSATGAVTMYTDEFGNTRTYAYDGQGHMTRVTDTASGRYIDISYGGAGRVSSIQDSAGRSVSYGYSGTGELTSVTDPVGHTTTYGYVQSRLGKQLSSVTDHWARRLTDITYDIFGRLQTQTQRGETFTDVYGGPGDQNAGEDPTLTGRNYTRNTTGHMWVLTHDPSGIIVRRETPTGSVSSRVLDSRGFVAQTTDEFGVKTTTVHDTLGKVLSVTQDDGGPTPVRWDYTYDTAFPEKVATMTPKNPSTGAFDGNWQGFQYEYYASGSPAPGALWKVKRLRSDGTTTDLLTTYEYDQEGRVTRQTSATGGQTDYAYATNGDLQSVTGPANNAAGTRPVTSYVYDSLGRVTSVTDPLGAVTAYTYDALGRVLTVTLPKPTTGSSLSFVTTYSYDNWDSATGLLFTHVTDPNGKLTKLGYDRFGQLNKTIDAASGVTTYVYDRGLLASITDANDNVTSYTYDSLGRLTRTTFPNGAYESYAYWGEGLLGTSTNRKGYTTTLLYDNHKRVWQSQNSYTGIFTYTYQGQKLTQVGNTGTSPTETHTYAYDSSFRVSSETQATRGTLSYTYTAGDQLDTLTLPSGATTQRTYYPDGSLKDITWSRVSGTFDYTYDLAGRYQGIAFPNGQTRSYTYDDQGRLTQLVNAIGSTNLATYAYGYDVDNTTGTSTMLGQRTSLSATVPAQSFTNALSKYYYDPLYQLTKVDYPSAAPFNGEVRSWTYDAIGNRTSETVGATTTSYTYTKNGANPKNGQRLQSDGVETYGYDANGSVTSRGALTLAYTQHGWLSSLSGSVSASYKYDYTGRRVAKTAGASSTYLYSGQDLVADSTSSAEYLYGPGIDEPLATYSGGGVYYTVADALGSVALTTDSTGVVTRNTVLDAWGSSRSETGTRTDPFTYTGREVGEAGLLFYRARYYQPSVGRFLQEDPAPLLEANAYPYVENGPVDFWDPSGAVRVPCQSCDLNPSIVNAKNRINLLNTTGSATDPKPGGSNKIAASTKCSKLILVLPDGSTVTRYQATSVMNFSFSDRPCTFLCTQLHEAVHRSMCQKMKGRYFALTEKGQELPAYKKELECLESAAIHGFLTINAGAVGY